MTDKENILSQEFAQRISNYKNDKSVIQELQIVHLDIFGSNFKMNCSNCLIKAFNEVRMELEYNNKPIKKTMGQFEIAKGSGGLSKQIELNHEIFTNANLTDEIALMILKAAPGHIVTFSKYPENWKELAKIPAKTKAEIKAKAEIEEPIVREVFEGVAELVAPKPEEKKSKGRPKKK